MSTAKGELKAGTAKTLYGKCEVCKKDFEWSEDDSLMFARIQRGYFRRDDDGGVEESNIKAEFWICTDCYLKTPSLCQFFNSIGWRVR